MSAADVGTLALGSYSKATSSSALVSTDTISDALGKLEYKLDTISSELNTYKINTDNAIAKKAEQTDLDSLIARVTTLENKVK